MEKKLVYAKHPPHVRCGIAYFAQTLAYHVSARLIHSFHGFSKCDELIINLDILELEESEISSLLKFISLRQAKKTILIMHDYRFSYLEDELVKLCDIVVNLSGEPALKRMAGRKMIELFTPGTTKRPLFGFTKKIDRPLTFAFGFFSSRKKSFKIYTSFYEFMLKKFPKWYHIMVASKHAGQNEEDVNSLSHILNDENILVLNFLPNILLSELISASDLGVCFYPTGIMLNNAAPMAFFLQGKPVITTYGSLTPSKFKKFTLDAENIDKINFYDMEFFQKLGMDAYKYYWKNLSWEVFLKKMYVHLKKHS